MPFLPPNQQRQSTEGTNWHENKTKSGAHTSNGPFSGTMQVSQYQKGKTNLDFTDARDSEWQWHQLDRMQVCTSLEADNHASTPPLSFFTGWMPFLPPNQASKHRSGARYLKYHNQNKFPIKSKMYTKHYVKFCTKAFIWRKLQVLTSWSKSTFLDSPPTYKACNLWTKDNQILLFYAITSYTLLVNITIFYGKTDAGEF